MALITMSRVEGQREFRLRAPQSEWCEVAVLEVAVEARRGRAREGRAILRALVRRGLVSPDYEARAVYSFSNKRLVELGVVCWRHGRAICCNKRRRG